MKRPVVILLHCAYWLLYLLLLTVMFLVITVQSKEVSAAAVRSLAPLLSLLVAPNMLAFYGFYFVLFPAFLSRQKIVALLFSGTLVCALSAILAAATSVVFFGLSQAIFTDATEFSLMFGFLFFIAAIHGGIALIIRGFVTWYDEIKLKEELSRKNFEMESALVRSQIDPHFLFNTLNNIDTLIACDPTRASDYLNQLSDILRYMVYDTRVEKIALSTEIAYIEKYLMLQKIRTANDNYVNFSVTGDISGFQIAPMIFFPFIENAFKHTENDKNATRIEIKILVENDAVIFRCQNSYQPDRNKIAGVGNELIKRRLELLYPNSHSLHIADENDTYEVKLTLK